MEIGNVGLAGRVNSPGEQVADVGTKVLSSPRLETLKKMMNMGKGAREKEKESFEEEMKCKEGQKDLEERCGEGLKREEKREDGHQEERALDTDVLEEALRMIVMAAMLQGATAQEEEEEFEENYVFWVACYVMVGFSFVGLWVTLYWCWGCCRIMSSNTGQRKRVRWKKRMEEAIKKEEGRS